ncbi:hypothetical protein ACHAPU_009339 [Fusarium lateritium]
MSRSSYFNMLRSTLRRWLESSIPAAVKQTTSPGTAERGAVKRKAMSNLISDAPSSAPVIDRERAMRKSQYSMGPRENVVRDSDDDYDEDNDPGSQVTLHLIVTYLNPCYVIINSS